MFKLMGGKFPDIPETELELRRILFLCHSASCQTYYDDGELQDHTCNIDFLRDSVEEIQRRLNEQALLRYTEQLEGDSSEEHF
ncbi:MAG: hypothetical protein PVI43_00180 [Candidatus Bathyarchaeota archaeon]|jgi:hypothetical protein